MATRKITDLSRATKPTSSDLLLIETSEGTRAMNYENLSAPIIEEAEENAARNLDNRNTYRGKNLGGSVTAAQKAAIQNGTFDDLFIGDYWTIGGVKWLIADMDYWYNCGDTAFTKHHLVIIPETALYNARMNASNTTEGGYVNSEMYKTGLDSAKATIASAFGSMVLTHREYLVNAVSNGKPSAGAWLDSTVELPNECMMYGHPHFAPACDGSTVPTLYTIDKTQFSLFALRPQLIVNRSFNQWLRDVVSSASFANVNSDGGAHYDGAAYSRGVRPVFAIG
ncbi:MAG: hypothetical protein NC347_04100 [Clostridium sp.]|nr:hypothetical protein [Clostridium sp.]